MQGPRGQGSAFCWEPWEPALLVRPSTERGHAASFGWSTAERGNERKLFNARPGSGGPTAIWLGHLAPWGWLQAGGFASGGGSGEAFQDGAGALFRPKDLSRATENRLLGLSSRDVTAH